MSILDCLNLDLIDLQIELQAHPVQGRWPCVRLQVDNTVVHNGPVVGRQKFNYSSRSQSCQEKCTIEIVFYNKNDQDTVVDHQEQIVENQGVTIVSVVANGVDLVKTNIIHKGFGSYSTQLSAEKRKYFVDHNINIESTTSLDMFENGVWHIEIGLPVLSFISGLHNVVEPWERVQVEQLVNTLYQQYLICKDLESHNDLKSSAH